MKSIFYFLVSIFLFLGISGQSRADEATVIQKTELSSLVNDINIAIKKGDVAIIATKMPDRLYKEMARRLDTTEANLRTSFLKKLYTQFENISAGSYHLDEKKIAYRKTDKGALYALIPTVFETKNRIIQYNTLAIVDNAQWYLIYGGRKTIENSVFLEIYPALSGINLPQEKIIEK
ncbi:hypothetical protein [Bartonella sp. F02]|uniref:hypothetical protein n=1 Tax=Bartonella sp. F02 TaxID=2967262 RepID=UPI0022A8D5D6|nr:hypothetical protein [Bartonella sp. F02]MCZ2328625.1 hypothetical protein [Bartonella sp. F02]